MRKAWDEHDLSIDEVRSDLAIRQGSRTGTVFRWRLTDDVIRAISLCLEHGLTEVVFQPQAEKPDRFGFKSPEDTLWVCTLDRKQMRNVRIEQTYAKLVIDHEYGRWEKENDKRNATVPLDSLEAALKVIADARSSITEVKNGSEEWSQDELDASIAAYMDLRQRLRTGEEVVKSSIYSKLHERFQSRSAKAFEWRFQNISSVLDALGDEWIPGLKPARNSSAALEDRIIAYLRANATTADPEEYGRKAAILTKVVNSALPPSGNAAPSAVTRTMTVRERDANVAAYVLSEAQGMCEACSAPAPFARDDDSPFLEVHHVLRLADGGADQVWNAVAVCPNCHRRLHHGSDRSVLVEALYSQVRRLCRPQ